MGSINKLCQISEFIAVIYRMFSLGMTLYHGSIEQAMERVYNSPLMTALQDEEGELYVQSPAYLYELMELLN